MTTIFWSPIDSILNNKPAGTVVIGMPGSGKTFFLLNTAVNALLTSVRVIYIDPKNDASSLVTSGIAPMRVTDVNNISPGALNPFSVLKDVSSNTILSIISCILGEVDDSKLISIAPIINDFVIQNKINGSCFSELADYLYASENEQAQAVGTTLKINEDSKYGKLLFANGDRYNMTNESEIISLFGMTLPSQGGAVTQEEKFSSAIVYIICNVLMEMLIEKNKKPTLVIIDEAHIVFSNPAIAKLIDTILVLGRSLNVCTILASQNITHFPKGISQLISSKFMFRTASGEAIEFLKEFDASSSTQALNRESVVEYIGRVPTGTCFCIDSKNRTGFIRIKSNLGVTSNPLFRTD